MAERILMNEFKALSKEKWVNVEVSEPSSRKATASETRLTDPPAPRRERLQLGHRPASPQPRLSLPRRLLQSPNDIPEQLPLRAPKFVSPQKTFSPNSKATHQLTHTPHSF